MNIAKQLNGLELTAKSLAEKHLNLVCKNSKALEQVSSQRNCEIQSGPELLQELVKQNKATVRPITQEEREYIFMNNRFATTQEKVYDGLIVEFNI